MLPQLQADTGTDLRLVRLMNRSERAAPVQSSLAGHVVRWDQSAPLHPLTPLFLLQPHSEDVLTSDRHVGEIASPIFVRCSVSRQLHPNKRKRGIECLLPT